MTKHRKQKQRQLTQRSPSRYLPAEYDKPKAMVEDLLPPTKITALHMATEVEDVMAGLKSLAKDMRESAQKPLPQVRPTPSYRMEKDITPPVEEVKDLMIAEADVPEVKAQLTQLFKGWTKDAKNAAMEQSEPVSQDTVAKMMHDALKPPGKWAGGVLEKGPLETLGNQMRDLVENAAIPKLAGRVDTGTGKPIDNSDLREALQAATRVANITDEIKSGDQAMAPTDAEESLGKKIKRLQYAFTGRDDIPTHHVPLELLSVIERAEDPVRPHAHEYLVSWMTSLSLDIVHVTVDPRRVLWIHPPRPFAQRSDLSLAFAPYGFVAENVSPLLSKEQVAEILNLGKDNLRSVDRIFVSASAKGYQQTEESVTAKTPKPYDGYTVQQIAAATEEPPFGKMGWQPERKANFWTRFWNFLGINIQTPE